MNRWFQRGNSRRFYRIDMPARIFVLPQSPIKDREIYATGANYFPRVTELNIAQKKEHLFDWVHRIQDQQVLLEAIFTEVVEFLEFFGYCTKLVSEGISPKSDAQYWLQVSQNLKGFKTLATLKAKAPKTYQYFKLIEDKYMVFLKNFIHSVEHSDTSHFEVDASLPYGFKIDEVLERFDDPKFAKVPLVQALLALQTLMDEYLNIYRHILDDNYLVNHPKEWKTHQINVSASGIAVQFNKRFKLHEKMDVYFYFMDSNRVLHFDASVVDIRSFEDTFKERIAMNFDFPNGKDQNFLQSEIEKYEIKECLDLEFSF